MFPRDKCLHHCLGILCKLRGSAGDIETLIWSSMAWTILIVRASPFSFFSLSADFGEVIWYFAIVTNGSPCWAVCRVLSAAFLSMVKGSASWAWLFVAVSTLLLIAFVPWNPYCHYFKGWCKVCWLHVAFSNASVCLITSSRVLNWLALTSMSVCMISEWRPV